MQMAEVSSDVQAVERVKEVSEPKFPNCYLMIDSTVVEAIDERARGNEG